MRFGDRLGLRRSALPQIHRRENDHCHSEKLALPVLKRLEPKLRAAEVLQRRHRLPAMCELFIAIGLGTTNRMPCYGEEEQDKEQTRERVFVQRKHPAAAADGPWRVWTVGCLAWVLVLGRRLVNRLRLRGSFLK